MLFLRNRHLFLLDLLFLPAVAMLAFVLRLDASGVQSHRANILLYIGLSVPLKLFVFYFLGLYRRFWRYASIDELVLVAVASGTSALLITALLFTLALPLSGLSSFPRSIPFIDGLLTPLVVGGPRFAIRLVERNRQRQRRQCQCVEKRILVMGAGDAGRMIVREMQTNPHLGLRPIGFLDDDPCKHRVEIHGLPVLGGRNCIPDLAQKGQVSEVIIAIPTAPGYVIREIKDLCDQAGLSARTIPGLYDILSGQVSVSQIRQVDIEDLLRRKPVRVDTAAVETLLHGRRVLVTGGGGSIGGELCRQIARTKPEQLLLLGHGENSIFHICQELKDTAPCKLVPVIADIRDRRRLASLFAWYRPELVFHAAAHKHVPLMEANACEAVSNNVWGTRNLVQVASQTDVSHLILISSDKAVKPTSVMGVTKRVAELLVYQAARQNEACFAAVRFGNVLGSRGSVVNIFKRQIAQGGPLTVTHPDMRRYFMTIPEAVQLVLQAAALGQGGEVFVLDMGEPIRIVDLATDLIRLSGLKPRVREEGVTPGVQDEARDWDIEVVFTGARPGEKLHEELFVEGETCRPTCHAKIFVAENNHLGVKCPNLNEQVDRLIDLAQAGDPDGVRRLLGEIVPNYRKALTSRT